MGIPGRMSSEQLTDEPGARGLGGSEPERRVRDDVQCPWDDMPTREQVSRRGGMRTMDRALGVLAPADQGEGEGSAQGPGEEPPGSSEGGGPHWVLSGWG